jgi:Zn-finger protein
MPEPKDEVLTEHFKFFQNKQCEFFPCHTNVRKEFNCLFCYCPLIAYECPGPYLVYFDKYGNARKDCSACNLNHEGIAAWNFIQKWLKNPTIWNV